MILATDLDRTLLPNGHEEYDNSIPVLFQKLANVKNLTLVYVSGQNLDLMLKSAKLYGIKLPDFFIAEVGTAMYKKEGNKMSFWQKWRTYTENKNPNWDREQIVKQIGMPDVLELQEGWKQNDFKISYYLREENKKDDVLKKIKQAVNKIDIDAKIVWSQDPLQKVGLIDILPTSATKVTALEFLRQELGEELDNVVYCGDSGNDILPLTFGYRAILPKNAHAEVVQEVQKIAKQKGIEDKVYVAGGYDNLNGNYSSGIIEGLEHFNIL